jgi:hypothetical protein
MVVYLIGCGRSNEYNKVTSKMLGAIILMPIICPSEALLHAALCITNTFSREIHEGGDVFHFSYIYILMFSSWI